ncbi:MAG: ABC transporter substrate-binding protein [Chloroflexi bacterium]|uniref:ABC transporter substrate-binding protein n=1 Tax=Candidatus Flexifilum breve TaxID=3140694 RepID=UPI003137387A|nr:ABC transporter substrate-binding protein [Chloroflexota bacterium]MBK9750300.1 ABC transporter substrate-binding protein [Chloroflexota bacterium]
MKKVVLFIVLLSLLVVPAFAQEELPEFIQHSDCEVDLTGQTVTVYHFGDISGSYAFITQPLLAGLADAAAYFNARGGICGATIVQDNRDTGGDLAQTQAAYDAYSSLDPKPDVIVLYASGDAELLRDQLAEDEIPAFISAGSVAGLYGEDGATPGWIYATNPLYADQIGSFCAYVGANPEQYPDPVIGYISWPGAFGSSAFTPETMAYCAEQGVSMLETPEYFLPTATDISGNVLNLVDAGANILYTNSLASGPFMIAKTVVDLGLEEDVQLAGVNWALDTSVGLLSRTALGSDGLPAVNGIVGSLPFLWWSERAEPGIALINEQAAANERSLSTQNIAYLLGWATVDTYVEMYIQTVNRVGSLDAVDGAAIQETIESMVYSPLGFYEMNFADGVRAVNGNRMATMMFLNATGDGVATSGDDAMKVDLPDGTQAFIPVLVPLTEFAPAPDLRPGGADVPAS